MTATMIRAKRITSKQRDLKVLVRTVGLTSHSTWVVPPSPPPEGWLIIGFFDCWMAVITTKRICKIQFWGNRFDEQTYDCANLWPLWRCAVFRLSVCFGQGASWLPGSPAPLASQPDGIQNNWRRTALQLDSFLSQRAENCVNANLIAAWHFCKKYTALSSQRVRFVIS